jgi:CRP/FNR family cyclic AMP-dependent transcriptional regulator
MKIPTAFRDSAHIRRYSADSVIFEAGQPGEEMFIVEEGEVEWAIDGRILETVGKEGFFGEMALIDHAPRSSTAVARTDCQLLCLNQHRFAFLIDEVPFSAISVMKVMADSLRRASRKET